MSLNGLVGARSWVPNPTKGPPSAGFSLFNRLTICDTSHRSTADPVGTTFPPAGTAAEQGPPGRCRVFDVSRNAKEIAVSQNLLSLTLSDAQLQTVDDALLALEGALAD